MGQVIKRGPEELKSLCKFLHQKFTPSTHWEGNVVLKSLSSCVISNRSYWQAFQASISQIYQIYKNNVFRMGSVLVQEYMKMCLYKFLREMLGSAKRGSSSTCGPRKLGIFNSDKLILILQFPQQDLLIHLTFISIHLSKTFPYFIFLSCSEECVFLLMQQLHLSFQRKITV